MSAATATDTFSLIGMEQRMRELSDAVESIVSYSSAPEHILQRGIILLQRIQQDQEILMRALRK